MSTSRKFEIKKKKLAVRRLSQGSRGKVTSPQGDGRFPFKPRLSPEDYAASQRRKLPPKPPKGHQNPDKWTKGDLRSKLQTRKFDSAGNTEQQGMSLFGNQQESKPHLAGLFKPVSTNATGTSEASLQLNPFVTVLESKGGTAIPKSIEESKNIFGHPFIEQKPSTSKDSNAGSSSFLNPRPEHVSFPSFSSNTKAEESNPFLQFLKEKTTPSNINPAASTSAAASSFSVPHPMPSEFPFRSAPTFIGKSIKEEESISEPNSILQSTSDTNQASVFAQERSLIADLKSLRLKGVPVELNNKEFLRGFYEQFGTVKRVFSHPASSSAVITFLDHDSAAKAKMNGKVFPSGTTISIFWNQNTPKTQSSQLALDEDKDMQEASNLTDKSKVSDDKVDSGRDAFGNEKEVVEPRRSSFAATIENFVNAFKSMPARGSMEKAEILEKIDQKIREGMRTETDLKKASHFVGTCPDMCPEKERYLREHRQRLATYEMQTGTEDVDSRGGQFPVVDASKVVKEYSRSSADQEKPLPHELRPGHVLQLTMNYLMLNVMDADDKNWADCYDFVWNRTRGIRKDITQQHLCDESSVDLIEKCTRFHIICSHHLCEEDINVFDPKINNEHLTKCLQSLKHMYEDLYLKKSIICPNEAEFRCYQILLNLNNGDILREITEFRQEVRESQEVKFALEVLRALNSTNYVRFFKLLHSGSYLMACIMQRYFNQIRSTGLYIMNKAYTSTSIRAVPIPLSDIARLFAIDELDEASEFCTHYGFQVDEGMVYFSKSSYEEPESNFLPVRNGIIDKKRTSSFGEVVNGKLLPKQFDYVPTNSFDVNGFYNGVYHTLALKGIYSDNGADAGKTMATSDKTVSYPMRVGKDDIKAMCLAVIIPVVNKEVFKICTDAIEYEKETMLAVKEATDDVIDKSVRTEVRSCLETEIENETFERLSRDVNDDVIRCVLEEEMRKIIVEEFEAEKMRKDQERRMKIFKLATEVSRDLMFEFVRSSSRDVLHEIIRLERHKMTMQMITQECEIISREYLERFLVKEIREICKESKEFEVKSRKEELERIKMKMITIRTRKIFKRWIKERETRIQIRAILHHFPPCSPLHPSPEMIRSLTRHVDHASQLPNYITMKNNVELTVSSVSNTAKRRDKHRDEIEKYHQRIVNLRHDFKKPFDFTSILQSMAKLIKTKSRRSLYSKLLFCSLDATMSSSANALNVEDIKEKFKSKESRLNDEDSCHPIIQDFFDLSASTPQGVVSLSIKGLPDNCSKVEAMKIKESKEFYGVSGFIVVSEMEKVNWLMHGQKLKDIFALRPKLPACPVLFVCLNCPFNRREIINNMQLEKLKEKGELSSFEIVLLDSKTDGTELHEELFASLLNLISETPEQPNLQCCSLPNLLEDVLQLNFFENIYNSRIMQRNLKTQIYNPSPIVELYNTTLDHFQEICTSKKLSEYSWPSRQMLQHNRRSFPDLTWNDQETFGKIENIVSSLRLPSIDDQIDPDGDWDEQTRYCLEYLNSILQNAELNLHSSELISRVECVVNRYLQKWKYHSLTSPVSFPWSLILEECVHVLLASLHRPQPDINIPRMVCFLKKDFYNFKPPKSWTDEVKFIKNSSMDSDALLSSTLNVSSRDDYIQQTLRELDDGFSNIENSLSRSNFDNSNADKSLDDLLKRQKLLDESLSKEKIEWSRLSDFCAKSSIDDPLQISSTMKRKRLSSEDPVNMGREKEDEIGLIDAGKKRPRENLESRVDDLLNEVKFIRSQFDLDEIRYHHAIDT